MNGRTEPSFVDRVAAMTTHEAFAGLTNGAKALVAVLPTWMDATGQICPSVATLVSVSGLSRSTVLRALSDLASAGIIRLVSKARQHRTAVYELGPTAVPGHRGIATRRLGRGVTGDTSAESRGVTDDTPEQPRGRVDDTSAESRGVVDDTPEQSRGVTGASPEVSPVTPEVRTEVPPLPPQTAAEPEPVADSVVRRGKPDAAFVASVLELGAELDARRRPGAQIPERLQRWRRRQVEEFWQAGGTVEIARQLADLALAAPRSMNAVGQFWSDLGGGMASWDRTVDCRRSDLKHAQSVREARAAERQAERDADLGKAEQGGPRPLSESFDENGPIYGERRASNA